MRKRLCASVLSIALLLSMVVTPGFAAGADAAENDVLLLSASNPAAGWFRDQLSEQGQDIYDALVDMYESGLMEKNESYDLVAEGVVEESVVQSYLEGNRTLFNDFAAAKDAFDLEHPEAWYVDSSYLSFRVTTGEDGTLHAYMGPGRAEDYYVKGVKNDTDAHTRSNMLWKAVSDIKAGAEAYGSDYEKVRYVHNEITHSISYRFETDCQPENMGYIRTAYALVTHEGVCEGYVRSFQMVLNELGIPCVPIHGVQTSGVPEDHMWCAVMLDGAWYVVDPTWDDPVGLDKDGNIKVTGKNGDDGGETETYLLVGQNIVGANWQPVGYVSSSVTSFEYPEISTMSYGSGSIEHSGLKVEYAPDGMNGEKSTVYHVSFNGDGLVKAAEKGYYFLVKMYDVNADGSVDEFDDWYYSVHGMHGVQGYFDPENDFKNSANKGLGDTDGYMVYNVSNCEYVEFAITTKAPPAWQTAQDLIDLGGYYEGDYTDILAETGLIFNENGGYEQIPYVRNASPGFTTDLVAGQEYTVHIEFSDPLYRPSQASIDKAMSDTVLAGKINQAPEALQQRVGLDYRGLTYSWGMNGNKPHTFADKTEPKNIRWTCETHESHSGFDGIGDDCKLTTIEYEFTSSKMWADDSCWYEFYLTGLVGTKSNKFPNNWGYVFENKYPFWTCPLYSGFRWNLWGQPQVLDNPNDLDFDELVVKGVDGKTQSLSELHDSMNLDINDMNGRIIMSVQNIGENRSKSDELADAISNSENVDVPESAVLGSSLFEIDFARICRCTVVETGQTLRLCVGFPDGIDGSMAGIVFKAYHFTRDIEGSCPTPGVKDHVHTGEIYSVEEIPITVTEYGLVITCQKFSPFEIVVLDAEAAGLEVDDSHIVILTTDGNGTVTSDAADESKMVAFEQGDTYEFTVVPGKDYVLDAVTLGNGTTVTVVDNKFELSYDDVADGSTILNATFVPASIKQAEEGRGESVAEPVVCNHTNTSGTKYQAATCIDAGHTAGLVCDDCHMTLSESVEIQRLGHNYENGYCVRDNAVDPLYDFGDGVADMAYVDDGTSGLMTFSEALKKASNGECGAIHLAGKVTVNESIEIDTDIVIDLHGFELCFGDGARVAITASNAMIQNGKLTGRVSQLVQVKPDAGLTIYNAVVDVAVAEAGSTTNWAIRNDGILWLSDTDVSINSPGGVGGIASVSGSCLEMAGGSVSAESSTGAVAYGVFLSGGSMVVNSGDIVAADGVGVYMADSDGKAAHLEMSGGRILDADQGITSTGSSSIKLSGNARIENVVNGIFISGKTHVDMRGGAAIEATNIGITGNGSDKGADTLVEIRGNASVVAKNGSGAEANVVAIYQPQNGTLNIYDDAHIESSVAIGIKSGTLNVMGGTISAIGVKRDTELSNSGIGVDGCAIEIDSTSAYSGNVKVDICGGVVRSENNHAVHIDRADASVEPDVRIHDGDGTYPRLLSPAGVDVIDIPEGEDASLVRISGGLFSSDIEKYLDEGCNKIDNGDGTYTVGDVSKVVRGSLTVADTGESVIGQTFSVDVMKGYDGSPVVTTLKFSNIGSALIRLPVFVDTAKFHIVYSDVADSAVNGSAYFNGADEVVVPVGASFKFTVSLVEGLDVGHYAYKLGFRVGSWVHFASFNANVAANEVNLVVSNGSGLEKPFGATIAYAGGSVSGNAVVTWNPSFSVEWTNADDELGDAPTFDELNIGFDSLGFRSGAAVGEYAVQVDASRSDYIVNVVGDMMMKVVPVSPMASNDSPLATVRAGDVLDTVGLDITFANPYTGETVTGVFAWQNGEQSWPDAGEHSAGFTFTPHDDASYIVYTGTATIVVTAKPVVTLSVVSDDDVVYDGSGHAVEFEAACDGLSDAQLGDIEVFYSAADSNQWVKEPPVKAGTYQVKAVLAKNEHHDEATASTTLTVLPAVLTLEYEGKDKEYDGKYDADVTVSVSGVHGDDDVEASVVSAAFESVGAGDDKDIEFFVELSGDDAANYVLDSAVGYMTTASISRKAADIAIDGRTKTYGEALAAGDVTYSVTGLVEGEDESVLGIELSCDGFAFDADVNEYSISCAYDEAGNYVLTVKGEATLVVEKAVPELADGPISVDGTVGERLDSIVLDGAFVNSANRDMTVDGVLSWTDGGTVLDGTPGATVSYQWTFVPASGNYETVTGDATVTLHDGKIPAVSFEDVDVDYDGDAHFVDVICDDDVDYDVTYYRVKDAFGEDVVSTLVEEPTDAGTYKVVLVTVADGEYDSIMFEGTLVINPVKPVTDGIIVSVVKDGAKLSDVVFLGDVLGVNGETVDGTFSWNDVEGVRPEGIRVVDGESYGWTFVPTSGNYVTVSGSFTVHLASDVRTIIVSVYNLPDSFGYEDYAVIDVVRSGLESGETVAFYADAELKILVCKAAVADAEGDALTVRFGKDVLSKNGGKLYATVDDNRVIGVTEIGYMAEPDFTLAGSTSMTVGDTITMSVNTQAGYSVKSTTLSVDYPNIASVSGMKVTGLAKGQVVVTAIVTFANPDANVGRNIVVSKTLMITVNAKQTTPSQPSNPGGGTGGGSTGGGTTTTDNRKITGFVYNAPSGSETVARIDIDVTKSQLKTGETVEVYADAKCTLLLGKASVKDAVDGVLTVKFLDGALNVDGGSVYVKLSNNTRLKTAEIKYAAQPYVKVSGNTTVKVGRTTALTIELSEDYEPVYYVFYYGDSPVYSMSGNEITGVRPGEGQLKISFWFAHPDAANGADGEILVETYVDITVLPRFVDLYDDVSEDAWYHDALEFMYDQGWMIGTGGRTMAPNGTVTRAQLAQVLYRVAGSPAIEDDDEYVRFTDVADDAWYFDAIRWMSSQGIVVGYGNGKFGPGDVLTREQAFTMIYRFAGFIGLDMHIPGSYVFDFEDASAVHDWALDGTMWLASSGLVIGYNDRVMPVNSMTRAEMAMVVMRFYQTFTLDDGSWAVPVMGSPIESTDVNWSREEPST